MKRFLGGGIVLVFFIKCAHWLLEGVKTSLEKNKNKTFRNKNQEPL